MTMGTYVSMLRGINVGGKKAGMEKLKHVYESMGFKNVRSYIQSGNVLFDSPSVDASQLRKDLEKGVEKAFGFQVSVIIRTDAEIKKVIANNPLVKNDPTKLHVTFLLDRPDSFPIEEIEAAKDRREDFALKGKEVYLYCPNGYGRTKLSNTFFERKLKTVATTRNWNTVNAFLAMSTANA
jgi:uncharacterized protein (DUF1697 family)